MLFQLISKETEILPIIISLISWLIAEKNQLILINEDIHCCMYVGILRIITLYLDLTSCKVYGPVLCRNQTRWF